MYTHTYKHTFMHTFAGTAYNFIGPFVIFYKYNQNEHSQDSKQISTHF